MSILYVKYKVKINRTKYFPYGLKNTHESKIESWSSPLKRGFFSYCNQFSGDIRLHSIFIIFKMPDHFRLRFVEENKRDTYIYGCFEVFFCALGQNFIKKGLNFFEKGQWLAKILFVMQAYIFGYDRYLNRVVLYCLFA